MKKERTKIAWLNGGYTFNPWIGCTKVSPGCRLCYAEAQDHRWGHDSWGKGKPRRRTTPAYWASLLEWDRLAAAAGKREKVFVASFADWADQEVPEEWRYDLFHLLDQIKWLDILLLTKRIKDAELFFQRRYGFDCPLPAHFWVGATACNQPELNSVMATLQHIRARVKWLSLEPLLDPVFLHTAGALIQGPNLMVKRNRVDWVVVGGESGPKFEGDVAAPFDPEWVRSLAQECRQGGIPLFVKQMGSRPVTLDLPGKGDDPKTWPQDLQVEQFPDELPFTNEEALQIYKTRLTT